ncbi:MAG: pyridoxamine 5'-phosphate oxidase family protein [Lachnospiraceae bacterium]|nr:pyridoxamine 5'-phosphate oxidase family protein [Lachnospiraceae bacterium]
MTHEEYKVAANHWIEKDAVSKKMPANQLWPVIENYIQANNTCALATGSGSFIRCTPIEYTWYDGAFWMFSEGGQKFVGLEGNKSVCLAIYDRYDGFGKLKGLQVSGKAEIVEPFSEEYIHAAERKKVPVDALKKLPFTMNLIKITPTEIEFLNSDFKEDGYDSRQHYDCGREEA